MESKRVGMAELSTNEIERLVDIFCEAYNRVHKTTFASWQFSGKQDDVDFFLIDDKGNTLPIQHTRCEHIEDFFHSSHMIRRFQKRLEEKLKEFGVPNVLMVLHYLKLPNKETETENLINELASLIYDNSDLVSDIDRCEIHRSYKEIYKHGKTTSELEYGVTGFTDRISKYVSHIELRKSHESLVVILSQRYLEPKPLDSEAEDLLPALDKKNLKYGSSKKNLIFLIESYPGPPTRQSIEKTKEALRTKPPGFREVWAIFRGEPRFCGRIWPSADNEEVGGMP